MRLRLPCDPRSARRGRSTLRRVAASWDTGMDCDQLYVLELLTSELITNCLVHACSVHHDVIATHDAVGIRVSVSDGQSDRPVLLPDEHPSVLGGRGLVLVHTYADDWGIDELPAGKATWFRLNFHPRPSAPTLKPQQPRLL